MNEFTTARLSATRLMAGDLADLVDLHLDPDVSRFLGGVRTPGKTADYLDANLRHWADHGFGLYTLRTLDGAFTGRAGLRFFDLDARREVEVAYTLARRAWGAGLATEISQAFVALWQTRFIQPSIIGIVMKGNAASERVLAKAGLAYERDVVLHGEFASVFRRHRDR